MSSFVTALLSTVQLGGTAVVALIIVISILRGSRNKYVGSSTYVLDSFSLNPAATAEEPFIRLSGRHQGVISWLMTLLGLETRIDLTVGAREWVLRSGSLAGMLTTSVPLGHVEETICGYQRSLLALFLTIFFSLNSLWSFLACLVPLAQLFSADSESAREHSATALSGGLEALLAWLALTLIVGTVYYFSKRIAFAVSHQHISGFVFKRSFIGNHVVDLAQMEEAAFLLNRLVRAAYYEEPGVNIPQFTPRNPAEGSPLLRWWMLLPGYAVLGLFALLLGDYGAGFNLAIHTVPPNTAVWLDNGYAGQTNASGSLVLQHLSREHHTLRYEAAGYQQLDQAVTGGTFESEHKLDASLSLMSYPVKLYTTPSGVSISLDGQQVGTSNSSGFLFIPSVTRGRHQLSASLNGYTTVDSKIDVAYPRSWQVALISNAEEARQQQAAQQSEIAADLNQGRILFRAGKYQDAVNECDTVLKADPANHAAIALKRQIEQTRRILGQ